ncbi:PAAR domain-containing protein [Paraburkholderia phosphatilytica]|uniref:PAAR domain-containing protein n=1 Tax=Paraburkholderia phosphatilytica TaxID=2282883 RepID=UPI000E47E7DF|nr:PAAR domain-containing protein [Paraburkholderia phosphatilytica]
MSRRFILKDDKTDHDGVVLDGISGSSFGGRPLAYLGAPVQCHTCHTEGTIITDGSPHTMSVMNKQVALERDLCQCKCQPLPKLVASQSTGALSS